MQTPGYLEASRGDAPVQAWAEQHHGERRQQLLRKARPCPICGAAAENLAWFWFTSSWDSWAHLAGRAVAGSASATATAARWTSLWRSRTSPAPDAACRGVAVRWVDSLTVSGSPTRLAALPSALTGPDGDPEPGSNRLGSHCGSPRPLPERIRLSLRSKSRARTGRTRRPMLHRKT
jgi:hypothetical protein